MQVYTKEFLRDKIVRSNSSFDKAKIDKEVKELREQGFKVRRKKYGNMDGSGEIYTYEATKCKTKINCKFRNM